MRFLLIGRGGVVLSGLAAGYDDSDRFVRTSPLSWSTTPDSNTADGGIAPLRTLEQLQAFAGRTPARGHAMGQRNT
jgi:hypothetical protein